MPEGTSQAAPAAQVTAAGAQVLETTTQPVSPQPEPQTEAPLTPEQIAYIERIADQRATRIAQSQVAKGENRIQESIRNRFAALEQTKGTLGLTDEQVNQAKQKIVAEAFTSAEEPEQTTPPANPDVDQAIQFMNAEIENVFSEVGTAVTKDDPEFKDLQAAIDAAWNDPKGLTKILLAANKTATAKLQRLQQQSQHAAARVVGGGAPGGQAQTQAATAHDAWEQAYKK